METHNQWVLLGKWDAQFKELMAVCCLRDLDFVGALVTSLTLAKALRNILNWSIEHDDNRVKIWMKAYEGCEFRFSYPIPKTKHKVNWQKEGF